MAFDHQRHASPSVVKRVGGVVAAIRGWPTLTCGLVGFLAVVRLLGHDADSAEPLAPRRALDFSHLRLCDGQASENQNVG